MKKIFYKIMVATLFLSFMASCDDLWNQHYEERNLESGTLVEVYKGYLQDFMESQDDLTVQHALFKKADIYSAVEKDQQYTVLVYVNDLLSQSELNIDQSYAKHCISNVAISPDQLKNGLGIFTRYGKTIWVYERENDFYIDDYKINRYVKTKNAYIYYIDNVIPIRKSLYEVFKDLNSDYSLFKTMVERYEDTYFDKDKSVPSGYNNEGNVVYSDSVFTIRNKLMNRYTVDGLDYWNMIDEKYSSTLLLPSNAVIQEALDSANARVTRYLGRPMTFSDLRKFEEWIIKVCFYNKRLTLDDLNTGEDIEAVGSYMKDTLIEKFRPVEPAVWRPSVQKVSTSDVIHASNGDIYLIEQLKIPNYVLIDRLKTIIWRGYNARNGKQYYEFENWINVTSETYGNPFQPHKELPAVVYDYMKATPSEEAIRGGLVCSVEFDGLLYNAKVDTVQKVKLPAGDYYMMIGMRNVLYYSVNVYFNNSLVIRGLAPFATGADTNMDRYTGAGPDGKPFSGYPEFVDPWRWSQRGVSLGGYDGDGYPIGTVKMEKEDFFRIRIESDDHAKLWKAADGNTHLVLYHWCLRPTKNNY